MTGLDEIYNNLIGISSSFSPISFIIIYIILLYLSKVFWR